MNQMVMTREATINGKEILDFVHKVVRKFKFEEHTNQDLVQDIMLKLHLKSSTFNGKSSLKTWLYSVIKNHCLNFKQRVYKNYLLSMSFNDWDTVSIDSENGESALLLQKLKEMVNEHVNKLPDHLRLPIRYFYYENMKYKSISKKMDIPMGTVKSRINTAKMKLKKWFVTKSENAALLAGGRRFKEFIWR